MFGAILGLTGPQLILIAFLTSVTVGISWRAAMVLCQIIEWRVAAKLKGTSPEYMKSQSSIPNGNGKISALAENHDDLRNEMRRGFESMAGKMDAQHKDLHRRIDGIKDKLHADQLTVARKYATKDDLRDIEQRFHKKSL